MAIIQALLATLARSLGKLLNTVFGWATTMLFGKVPEDRQLYLSVIGLGSVLWIVVVLGIAFPSVGTFLLAFVPLPDGVDAFWVRMAMLAAALILPAIIGFISLFLVDKQDRPKGFGGKLKAVARGYPYTLGLALTLLMMIVVAPIMKIRDIIRGWTSTHVPVVVESEDYFGVLDTAQAALKQVGYDTRRESASWMVRLPTKVFTTFAGDSVDDLVADELSTLKGKNIEVTLHPSDLVISGKKEDVARVQSVLAVRLAFSEAYLTWTKEAQKVEDKLIALWREADSGEEGMAKLWDVVRDLRKLKVPYEEWEVLFREKLLVERALLIGTTDEREEEPEPAGAGRGQR